MNSNLKDKINEILDLKEKIESFKPFNEELNQTIQEKLRIEWTYNSNALEGNTLTLGETAFFLREGLTSEGRPFKDFLETQNHAEAIELLERFVRENQPVTEHFIKTLHQLLLKGIDYTEAKNENGKIIHKPLVAGQYKIRPNHVLTVSGAIHHYTAPEQVQIEIEKLLDWLKSSETKKLSTIEQASLFHYKFVSIHPFDDGNGRLARLLMNLIFMRDGFPPCIIQSQNRRQYLSELEKIDQTNDFKTFTFFIAQELKNTLSTIYKSLTKKDIDKEFKSSKLTAEARKLRILSLFTGDELLPIRDIQQKLPQIKRPTLKKDLQNLVTNKRLRTQGKGKGLVYLKA